MALEVQQHTRDEKADPHYDNNDNPGHDLKEIKSIKQFLNEARDENKRICYLAGPVIFTCIAQYSLGATTQVFAGHLSTLELDAVSMEDLVISGLAYGIMLGMASALETICGQAYGAKQLHMLGVYMQRSWVILTLMCICLLPIYLFATPILRLFHQNEEIASLAGKFSLYGLGLVGAAIALNASWWFIVFGQFSYIAMGYCPGAWNGFSRLAFKDLAEFTKLSIGSAIMICLEFWNLVITIVVAGNLKNAQIAVGAMSICLNLFGWHNMIFLGFNAAISVRISNELGAGRPRAAKFSILVVLMSSMLLMPFPVLPFSLPLHYFLINGIQPVLSGVAIGAGWQWLIAYVNLGSYYLIGFPLGFVLAFPLKKGVQGMWTGQLCGVGLQTAILIIITLKTNWDHEASQANSRIEKWGGSTKTPEVNSMD
ncbi:Protein DETOXIFICATION [Rhynchospora pubera]|uniref:Protein DETOXIFICATION n=1 Tax=Rhynchospora pubera TaxID=906938 RepID=A0AAV8EBK9_9POAL|nr:Protein DETOXIFICATION [Rhynchospora pubera]